VVKSRTTRIDSANQTHLKVADHVACGRNLGAVMAKGAEGRDLEGRGVRADAELHDLA
jgi:hypothetical protein